MVRALAFDALHAPELERDYERNPFPLWRYLRQEQPLLYDSREDRWLLTRYDDVVGILADPQTYSTRTYQDRFRAVLGQTLAELDGPPHARLRAIASPALTGQHVVRLRPLLRAAADELIDGLAPRGAADLVADFSRHLPVMVIMVLLGLPTNDHAFVLRIAGTMVGGLEDVEPRRSRAMAARAELAAYLQPIVAQRRAMPADDLISHIVRAQPDGRPLSHDEIVSYIAFLLAAGGATADTALANFWWNLLSHPEYLPRVQADPDLMQAAFSESMRRDGSIVYEDRLTNRPVELYGRTLPVNSTVVVCLGSANTDERVFGSPEAFVPERADLLKSLEHKSGYRQDGVAGHLGFGLGAHFCMGYQLARAEIVVATEALLNRVADLTWNVDAIPPLEIEFFVRTVPTLPVRFRTRDKSAGHEVLGGP